MRQLLFTIIMILISATTVAENITVKAEDCGPLARGELGVVFHVKNNGSRQTYFAKGKAQDVCPRLMNNNAVVGYEVGLCENGTQATPNECATVKEFIILSYKNK